MSKNILLALPFVAVVAFFARTRDTTAAESTAADTQTQKIVTATTANRREEHSEISDFVHKLRSRNQFRNALTGSVRIARQAGKEHAASEAITITTRADPSVKGSRGLTL
jgi:hypothetical protein